MISCCSNAATFLALERNNVTSHVGKLCCICTPTVAYVRERLTPSAVSHIVLVFYPYKTRQHNKALQMHTTAGENTPDGGAPQQAVDISHWASIRTTRLACMYHSSSYHCITYECLPICMYTCCLMQDMKNPCSLLSQFGPGLYSVTPRTPVNIDEQPRYLQVMMTCILLSTRTSARWPTKCQLACVS